MLLAIDAGNTNVTLGVFDGAALTHRWRLRTVREQTADEWGVLMRNLFSLDEDLPLQCLRLIWERQGRSAPAKAK